MTELRVSVMRLARRLRRERSSDDLTLTQLSVMATLERNGPCTLGQLAAEERISAPSVTRIVNHLVDAGMLARRSDERDGRLTVVELTPAAAALLAANRRRGDLWLAEQLRQLSADQREALSRAIEVLEIVARS